MGWQGLTAGWARFHVKTLMFALQTLYISSSLTSQIQPVVCQNLTMLCAQHVHTTQHSSYQHNGNVICVFISLFSPYGFLSQHHLDLLVRSETGKFQHLHWHVVLRESNDCRVSATCRPIPAHPLLTDCTWLLNCSHSHSFMVFLTEN